MSSIFLKKPNTSSNPYSKSVGSKKSSSNKTAKCANPVFEKWIIELRDDAMARELQSKHTYTKCLNSLRKYPLPLNTGKECIILEGFGDKICKQIDEYLEKFLREGGELHPPEILDESSENEDDILANIDINTVKSNNKTKLTSSTSSSSSKSSSQTSKKSSKSKDSELLVIESESNSSNSDSDDDRSEKTETNKKKSNKSNKEYIPAYRSGPYALLITLYNNEQDQGANAFMLKKPLMTEAQKHCDSSFCINEPNSRYTAWNSMSALIKKDLVIKENKLPARYLLTESGRKLAYRLLYGITDDSQLNVRESEAEKSVSDDDSVKSKKKKIDQNVSNKEKNSKKAKSNQNTYTDESDNNFEQIPSYTSISQSKSFEREFTSDKLEFQFKKSQPATLSSNDVIEILSDDSDDCVTLDSKEDTKKTNIVSTNTKPPKIDVKKNKKDDSFTSEDDNALPDLSFTNECPNYDNFEYYSNENDIILNNESNDVVCSIKSTKATKTKFKKYDSDSVSSTSTFTQEFSSQSISNLKISSQTSSGYTKTIDKELSSISSTSIQAMKSTYSSNLSDSAMPNILFTLPPGTFDILLYVDNCEQSHAKRQDILMDELKKSKIKFETGKLNVGDFTWIARTNTGSSLLSTDLVLDYVVERKRMDDFCSSIIDGRYKEQKFRLKKCGIRNCIYLLEDYGSLKHMSLPEKSIVQADVNTQLIDDLIVHHTTDPKDTANYLIEMTHYLIKAFKNERLNGCTKESLDSYYKSLNIQSKSKRTHLMTLEEFNQFSNKNKPLTIREMFAKCLMKIQGVSQEKTLSILEYYPTPTSLFKEFSKCKDENARTKLIANLKYGSQQRNIGPAIGKVISQLFCTDGPLN